MTANMWRADNAWEGLIWLVLAIVWVIVQVIGRAAKQARKGPPLRPGPRPEPDRSLEEFLKALGAEPAPPLPSPPPPVQKPIRPRRRPAPSGVAPPAPGSPVPPPEPTPEIWQRGLPPLPEMGEGLVGRRLLGKVVIPKIPVLRVMGMRLPASSFQGGILRTHQRGPVQQVLKSRADLRRAMLCRLILEPPHAFRF